MRILIPLMAAIVLIFAVAPALKAQETSAAALTAQGWEAVRQEDLATGLAKFQAALGVDPQNKDARVGEAHCLLYLNRLKEAQNRYAGVVAVDPKNYQAHLGLARAYNWQGRYEEAAREYRRFLKYEPSHQEALAELSQVIQWNQQERYGGVLNDDPRNRRQYAPLDAVRVPSQRFFFNYLDEQDGGGFRSHTLASGVRFQHSVTNAWQLFGQLQAEEMAETGKGSAAGQGLLLGSASTVGKWDISGQVDLRHYASAAKKSFVGGLVSAKWTYWHQNSLNAQFERELFDVLDGVSANRYSAGAQTYLHERVYITNDYQRAELSDGNRSDLWFHNLTWEVLRKAPADLSLSAGWRWRDFEETPGTYYAPIRLGSWVYGIYAGKSLGRFYSYTQGKYFNNSDDIDAYSFLLGSEYTVIQDVSVSAEMSYFGTSAKYRALGGSLTFRWKF